ncbi:MAG: T9SS type A sorting domain-containing protein, partial [Chitinophagales bacterium]
KCSVISTKLQDVPFNCFLFNPNHDSILYSGNDFSVFISYDKGNNWEPMSDGWPDAAMAFDLQVSPTDNKLVVFTHGHGVYRTDLATQKPVTVNNAIPQQQIKIYPSLVSNNLFIEYDGEIVDGLQLNIFDIQGNIVLRKSMSNNINSIDCSNLPNGNYVIQLSGRGLNYCSKFVKI